MISFPLSLLLSTYKKSLKKKKKKKDTWYFQVTILNRLHHTSYSQRQWFGQPEEGSAQGTQGARKRVSSAPSMIWPCHNKVTWWRSKWAVHATLWKQVAAWSCHFLCTRSLATALWARPGALVSGQCRFVSSCCKGQLQLPSAKATSSPLPHPHPKKKKVKERKLEKYAKSLSLKANGQLCAKGQIPVVANCFCSNLARAATRLSVGRVQSVMCLTFEEATKKLLY